MAIDRLTVSGLRGFAVEQEIQFARPTGSGGSGLSLLIGPNGGGKSTVLEALRASGARSVLSFPIGSRNLEAGDRVDIAWLCDRGAGALRSVRQGSSETVREGEAPTVERLLHMPSRRSFNPYFGMGLVSREEYMGGTLLPASERSPSTTSPVA